MSENNQDDMSMVMTLTDEDGREVDVNFLGVIDYDNKEYVFFTPADEEAEEFECFVLQVEEENGEETYVSVEDDKLVDFLFDLFKEENKDTFDFVD